MKYVLIRSIKYRIIE